MIINELTPDQAAARGEQTHKMRREKKIVENPRTETETRLALSHERSAQVE